MNKILIALLVFVLSQSAAAIAVSPVYAQDYPFPPSSPDESWQPPYEAAGSMEPQVGIETYSQTWPGLQISPPPAVAPGTTGSIVNAYLVNSYGQPLTHLYRNGACYLIISLNGPGYFYLWEYYPSGTNYYGHWLCYRWYRPYAGIWRIGPFAAESSDPAGPYIWKMWFLSDFSWSTRTLSFNFTGSYSPPDIPGLTSWPTSPPVINSFTANKSSIEAGETAILTWTTTNADTVTISPGVGTVAASGSTSVTPTSSTTYNLMAKGRSGNTISSTATITVIPRIPPDISIGQSTIQSGQSTLLSWNAPGAVAISISDIGNVGIQGTTQVSPNETTTYTLTATYIDGTTQSTSVAVKVEQPPYLLWGIIALLAIAVITIVFLIMRRRTEPSVAQVTDTQAGPTTASDATHPADTLPATTPVLEAASAKLAMLNGNDILLAGNARALGRHDFEKFMPQENISYISRQHINIWYENGDYYIEDRSSTNGTMINGMEIKGSGRHALVDGDLIELAGKLSIIFKK